MFVICFIVVEVYESTGFMDALTSLPPVTGSRRKRKGSIGNKPTPTSPPANKQPTSPPLTSNSATSPPRLSTESNTMSPPASPTVGATTPSTEKSKSPPAIVAEEDPHIPTVSINKLNRSGV